jgi:Ca2+-binding RTX toxin-like protein
MWRRSMVLACALLVPVAIAVPQAGAATFASSGAITIPESGAANPYPSTINVAGIPGNVADVDVTLNGLTHTCMSDVRFLLVGPGGQTSILLSTAGGYCNDPVVNAVITLDDEASTAYPCNTSPSGTFKPTAEPITPTGDCEPATDNAFPPPAPGAPYPVALSAFDGHLASGTWSLFLFDQFGGDEGTLAGWSIDLIPVASCAGKAATTNRALVGTDGPDSLVGTPGPDVMVGFGGKDKINGLGGNDVICGGSGKDTLFGGPGKDLLRGEAGKDKLKGQGGKDTCVGGKGKDAAKACEKDKSI